MAKTVKVAQTSDLSPGTGKVVQADGRSVALFNVEGTFYAIDNTCTHRGGPLGEGTLSGDTVDCPWHGAHFNVKTGGVISPPAPATNSWTTRERSIRGSIAAPSAVIA